MFRRYRRWKRERKINKVKPGDGHPIKPFRWWHILTRTIFYKEFTEADGTRNVYAVNVNYFSEDETAELYLNGRHHATAKLPAFFPVPGGVIEVETTTYGLKRMHYVTQDDEIEEILSPHPISLEGLRLRFDNRYPRASNAIKYMAVAILLFSLVVGFPQLLEMISQWDIISERFGTFESPITLPNWLNVTLAVAGTLAALERALTLRNHWLIDMDTSWWGND